MSVIGNLKRHVKSWVNIGTNETVLNWIKNGVTLPFIKDQDHLHARNHFVNKVQKQFITSEIKSLLSRGAISQVDYVPFCVNPIGCVPKKGNKWRLITDLRQLNQNIKCPYFKNDSIDTVCDLVESNDNFITLDLKDGFQHIEVNEQFRTYLGFSWNGKYYVWNVLPYGLNVSPWYFNKLIRELVSYIRSNEIRFSVFVDDGILMSKPELVNDQKQFIIKTCNDLGLVINFEKSQLVPCTSVNYIGYVITSDKPDGFPWIEIPRMRITKLKRDINRALSTKCIKARFLARICGQLISFTKAILPTKLLLRNLYSVLQQRSDWASELVLTPSAIRDLKWWQSAINEWNGRPIVKRTVDGQIFTDASDIGWGASYNGLKAHGKWTQKEKYMHINERELLAVLLAVHSFQNVIKNKHIQVLSDNITTVAYINHLGGSSEVLTTITTNIWNMCQKLALTIEAKHLAGNLNCEADRLSRLTDQSTYSWSIHPKLFRILDQMWGPHTIDRFADLTHHVCPRYNSLFSDPYTSGIDALAQTDWSIENNFVNPPFCLIGQVLRVIIQQKAKATIIAPVWRAQPWFPILQRLSGHSFFGLPKSVSWAQGKRPEPTKNKRWKVCAWRVNGANY